MSPETLQRVKMFSQEENPKICECKHERRETGIFYSGIKLLQCLTCNGWQEVKKPIK